MARRRLAPTTLAPIAPPTDTPAVTMPADPDSDTLLTQAIIADILDHGLTYKAAAAKHGVSYRRVYTAMASTDSPSVAVAARQYMQSRSLDVVEHWVQASIEAATRGRHEASRDYLTHSGVVTPPESGQGRQSVAVYIGVQAAPPAKL